MDIEIQKLTPDLLEDYIYFFENTAHKDIEHDVSCYCVSWCSDDQEYADFSSAEIRKSSASQYVKNGIIQGYLAYYNGNVVGWCNANNRADCTKCYSWRHALASVNTESDSKNKRIKSVFCFTVNPDMRKNNIAAQLLEYVCEDAAKEGFDYVEGYPNKNFISIHDDFMGPVRLYLKCGFTIYSEIVDRVIMRKYLK